jgi:biopolymer transport protein ExbD
MAISLGGGEEGAPMSEMNTTPLIDVMLVLLIMFIITLPIQSHAVKIDLPVQTPPTDIVIEPVKNKVYISPEGAILWNGTPVDFTTLASNLEQTKLIQPSPELQLEPDANSQYVIVDQVLAVIKRSEVPGLGFVGNERYSRDF